VVVVVVEALKAAAYMAGRRPVTHMMTSKKQAARAAQTGLRSRQSRASATLLGGQVPPHSVFRERRLCAVIMSVTWVCVVRLCRPGGTCTDYLF